MLDFAGLVFDCCFMLNKFQEKDKTNYKWTYTKTWLDFRVWIILFVLSFFQFKWKSYLCFHWISTTYNNFHKSS